jgi:hypothetical protein
MINESLKGLPQRYVGFLDLNHGDIGDARRVVLLSSVYCLLNSGECNV